MAPVSKGARYNGALIKGRRLLPQVGDVEGGLDGHRELLRLRARRGFLRRRVGGAARGLLRLEVHLERGPAGLKATQGVRSKGALTSEHYIRGRP